jgi:DNA-binding GntR family transcriptional regulator
MAFKKVIIRDLRNAIASGTLRPGQRITETALCRQYGISRTPVREILKQLEKEGLVRIVPNAGARVVDLSTEDVSNIYEMQIVLEGASARFACGLVTDQEIRRLQECQFMIENAIAQKNLDLVFELNTRFHMLLCEFTKNPYLIQIRRNFATLMSRFGRFATYIPRHLDASLQEHPKIIDALRKRNAALAEFLAREHFEKAKEYMSAYIENLQKANEDTTGAMPIHRYKRVAQTESGRRHLNTGRRKGNALG